MLALVAGCGFRHGAPAAPTGDDAQLDAPADSAPDAPADGVNNNGGPTGIDAHLLGALDGIKRWKTVLPPAEICAHAGRTGC